MKRYMTILTICITVYLSLSIGLVHAAQGEKWESLFDGKTLKGWIQRNGKAKYEVEDGVIVGTTVLKTPNSFLCSEKMYSDFILELEFLVEGGMNSGVQIRSNSLENYKDFRVHGYQVEIDPSPRAYSGGIYDEARRGWLYDLKNSPHARSAFKQGQWNKFRVEAVGDSIKTWLNGVPASDLKDDMTSTGFIALQVHGSKEAGHKVRWRNIRIAQPKRKAAKSSLKVLIVDGQNNHNWKGTTPVLKSILEDSGMFEVDVATSPGKGQPMGGFKPDFAAYDVVVGNYTGADWPEETQKAFMDYMSSGGGFVVYHAADNAFPGWKEYNEMIGLGGWGGRDEKSGPMIRYEGDKAVFDDTPGRGGTHGPQHEFQLITRQRNHPITAGLPEKWMHTKDELYSKLRGPAKNLTVLATAYADPEKGGTGEHEPMLFTIGYGRGRIFQTALGHAAEQLRSVGFIVTFLRGAEWAATGNVTRTEVPADFPTADKVSLRAENSGSFSEIQKYDFGKSRKPLAEIEEQIRNTPPSAFGRVETQLLEALNSPETTFAGKQFVCRMLRRAGSAKSVPTLTKMLADKELSHMARFALQHMPASEAGDALREALGRLEGDLRVGVVGSIAQRGDRKAVGRIAKLINSGDSKLAWAAISALGRIGGAQAAGALSSARVPDNLRALRDNSLLMCADKMLAEGNTSDATAIYRKMAGSENGTMIRIAAFQGLVRAEKEKAVPLVLALLKDKTIDLQRAAGKMIAEMPGAEVTRAFAGQLGAVSGDAQLVLLSALESRGDKAAAPYIARMVGSGDESVRLAAVRALAIVGDASNVALLAKVGTEGGDVGKAAQASLSRLTGAGVTEALVGVINGRDDASVRANAIQVLTNRRETKVIGALLLASRDGDSDVRAAAYKAIGALAGQDGLLGLVAMLLSERNPSDRAGIERAMTAIVGRFEGIDGAAVISGLARADDAAKPHLLPVLSRIGGDNALQAVRNELKSSNSETKKAAIRALADWSDPGPLADLLAVSRKDSDPVNRILALRGYVKLVSLPANRAAKDTVQLLADGMAAAERSDEKRVILAQLPKYACDEAAELARQALKDKTIAAEAELAINKIKQSIVNKTLKATASINNGSVRNALDGNKSTRWDTGRGMKPGDWFMIDLGIESTVKGVTLDAAGSRGDYPRGYEVYASFDGGSWAKPIVTGKSDKPLTVIKFGKPVNTRYIKIVQTGSVPNLFWSIHDLKVEF